MAYENFRVETGSDGIAVVTWDMPDRSMNVFTAKVMDELAAIVEAVAADAAIKGAVIASGKKDFSGGADITMIHGLFSVFAEARRRTRRGGAARAPRGVLRACRGSTGGWRPAASRSSSAINGTCMGGATELALACHGRVMADDKATRDGAAGGEDRHFPGRRRHAARDAHGRRAGRAAVCCSRARR